MRILIVDGSPRSGEGDLGPWLQELFADLRGQDHEVKMYVLREMNLVPCTGCFGCWLRTPGLCVVPDDTDRIRRSFVHADLVLFATPLIMGLFSALMKNALDKLVPVVLPHLRILEGEMHHRLRYRRQPMLGVLVGEEDDTTAEDLDIVRTLFERNALNLGGHLALFGTASQSKEEIVDAIGRF